MSDQDLMGHRRRRAGLAAVRAATEGGSGR